MSYTTKSLIVMIIATVIALVAALTVAAALAFGVFDASAPDGLTLMGYVYGITDGEAVVTIVAMVAAMIVAMTGTITVGERVIV
jgi:hypothetical protein